jgi:hypothetical protein
MKEKLFATEADLCNAFLKAVPKGWTAYPETAGFDIMVVHDESHRQLGLEAKLRLNAKVISQILPDEALYGACAGPDYRGIIVPEGGGGFEQLLQIIGIIVFRPNYRGLFEVEEPRHPEDVGKPWQRGWPCYARLWHDFNPVKRCTLPEYVPSVAAGVPSPIQLTPWKIGALKVLAALKIDGYVTAADIRMFGVDPRRFCASDGWLESLGEGRWGRGKVPAFDEQHPAEFAAILAKAQAKRGPIV